MGIFEVEGVGTTVVVAIVGEFVIVDGANVGILEIFGVDTGSNTGGEDGKGLG